MQTILVPKDADLSPPPLDLDPHTLYITTCPAHPGVRDILRGAMQQHLAMHPGAFTPNWYSHPGQFPCKNAS